MAVNAFSVFATPWEKIVMIIVIIVGLFAAHYLQFKATALFGIFARPWDLAHHLISKCVLNMYFSIELFQSFLKALNCFRTQNNPEYKNEDNSEKNESTAQDNLDKKESNIENYLEEIGLLNHPSHLLRFCNTSEKVLHIYLLSSTDRLTNCCNCDKW